jgi:tetratricopeptide (TPR) repeat protein
MSRSVKIGIYLVLAACVITFGVLAARSYSKAGGPRTGVLPDEPPAQTAAPPRTGGSNWALYGALAFAAVVALSILGARDVSQFFATKVEEFVFNDDLKGVKDPEYEEAEKVWVGGNHLEAIQLMRDYLKKHPREQYVALRIAEIYEKDLGNPLAAALEYEEVLKKKLPSDRWGWAAIRLSNLYSGKLNKTEAAEALLRRIINEHPDTPAAKKARERLGEPEQLIVAVEAPPPQPEAQEPAPKSNLPPGFRPKT